MSAITIVLFAGGILALDRWTKYLAEAEVKRAEGIAASMEIVAEKLKGNQEYLQYWAIQAQMEMADSPNHTTVYIPSGDNGIPLVRYLER